MKQSIIYHDILKSWSGSDNTASYRKNYSSVILEHSSDYYLAVDRWQIPLSTIPIFTFNPNIEYSIELTYNNVSSGVVHPTYISTSPLGSDTYYNVYNFSTFIKMINDAITTGFNQLGLNVTLPVNSLPPHFEIDYSTGMLSYVAQKLFYESSLTSPIILYMNYNLWGSFFNGPPINYYTSNTSVSRAVSFNVYNLYNNTITLGSSDYYKMQSCNGSDTLTRWNTSKGIVITTNMATGVENMPTLQNSNETILDSQNILANFDFVYDQNNLRPLLAQYVTTNGQYKWIDLVNDTQLKEIDFRVYYYDGNNNLTTLKMYPTDTLTMRLVFKKKNIEN